MDVWKDTQLRKLSCEKDLQRAYRLALDFFNFQGFEYCAFVAHSTLPDQPASKINLNNYPYGWERLYERNGYASTDPIIAHCNQSSVPRSVERASFFRGPAVMARTQSARPQTWLDPSGS
ncbi:autoinducer binding domain-containing protein [Pseudomonas sp. SWRI92]|uniref:autoinducer binding domain-containing protein n=1 Tax=Pseudomonas sp. SWRI92 TaxID=2745499 RepID=UPI001EE38B05|nr:autoinducer binding domain-containing protein [Pseudomonas sp. SWRI92]